jgi:hypothetical protein
VLDERGLRYAVAGKLVWHLKISEIRVIGEYTNGDGPLLDDYFYVFALSCGDVFEAAMYARPGLMSDLSLALGASLHPGLANSAQLNSRVLWPETLAGQPLFTFVPFARRRGILNRLADSVMPVARRELTEEVRAFLGQYPRI